MTDTCAGRDMSNIEGSDVCGCDFVAVREGHGDAGSHRGYIDAVFCIAQKMTSAAGFGNGEGTGGRGDDFVAVKSINYMVSLN